MELMFRCTAAATEGVETTAQNKSIIQLLENIRHMVIGGFENINLAPAVSTLCKKLETISILPWSRSNL